MWKCTKTHMLAGEVRISLFRRPTNKDTHRRIDNMTYRTTNATLLKNGKIKQISR